MRLVSSVADSSTGHVSLVTWRKMSSWSTAAQGNIALLPELVAELVRSKVDIIVAATTEHAGVLVAKRATTTIPFYAAEPVDQFDALHYYVDKILKGTKPADLPVERP